MSSLNNQNTFNNAFSNALKNYEKKKEKKMSGPLVFYTLVHLIFLVWGVMLAFRSVPRQNRVMHLTLAIVFGPAYVLGYYINEIDMFR
jgi:hypothetical protein